MKVKVITKYLPRMTLSEFAQKHDLSLEVIEHWNSVLPYKHYFTVKFPKASIIDESSNNSLFLEGHARTVVDAIRDYMTQISCRQMLVSGKGIIDVPLIEQIGGLDFVALEDSE